MLGTKIFWVVKIPRMNMHIAEREEPMVHYEPALKRRSNHLTGLTNLVLLLAGVYAALFVESFAKYIVLLIIAALYFFARIE